MIKERIKEFSGLVSVVSVLVAFGAVSLSLADINGPSQLVGVVGAAIGAGIAAAASLIVSRLLRRERAKGRVFLIYAREDSDKARELYEALAKSGFRPWLDTEDIRPGERWATSVQKALEESPVALVLVSDALSSKRGFVQKELKMALSLLQDQPEGNSPVIPVRLVESEVPEPLRDIQWVDLFRKDGFQRLRQALELRGI